MEKNINFIVKEDERNLRVDVLINKREELISRTRIKNLILKEKLTLNNEIIKSPSKKVSIGDTINLKIPEPEIASLKPCLLYTSPSPRDQRGPRMPSSA